MSTTAYYRHEKMTTYPRCSNCRMEVTDYTYAHSTGRLCKLCFNASSDPRNFEFRATMIQRMREDNAK